MRPSLWSILRNRWRDTRVRKTLAGTTLEIGDDLWEFVLESTPQRRRSRYGDVEYDWDHQGVDTTSATVSARTRLLAAISGAPYQPTDPGIFAEMLQALRIDFGEFTFIDIGSGKGRTLLMAAEAGFRQVIGVELLPELHEVAARNIANSGRRNIESVCVDAREYQFPSDPLVLYLFNPLPAAAITQLLKRLGTSLEKQAREVKVIYHNPLFDDALASSSFLKKVRSFLPIFHLFQLIPFAAPFCAASCAECFFPRAGNGRFFQSVWGAEREADVSAMSHEDGGRFVPLLAGPVVLANAM